MAIKNNTKEQLEIACMCVVDDLVWTGGSGVCVWDPEVVFSLCHLR